MLNLSNEYISILFHASTCRSRTQFVYIYLIYVWVCVCMYVHVYIYYNHIIPHDFFKIMYIHMCVWYVLGIRESKMVVALCVSSTAHTHTNIRFARSLWYWSIEIFNGCFSYRTLHNAHVTYTCIIYYYFSSSIISMRSACVVVTHEYLARLCTCAHFNNATAKKHNLWAFVYNIYTYTCSFFFKIFFILLRRS